MSTLSYAQLTTLLSFGQDLVRTHDCVVDGCGRVAFFYVDDEYCFHHLKPEQNKVAIELLSNHWCKRFGEEHD